MDLKHFEFNGITKWYHNKIITHEDNTIVNEQWFRFQLLKIFDILGKSNDTKDELNIILSNELLIEKLTNYNELFIEKKIDSCNKELLKKYGLEKIKTNDNNLSIPIPKENLTINDLDKLNKTIKWKPWTISTISTTISDIFEENESDNSIIEESNYSKLMDEEEFDDDFGIGTDTDSYSYIINEFIENHFTNSDQMEKQGDCFFDSILTILKEFNEAEYSDKKAIDLRKEFVQEKIMKLDITNLKEFASIFLINVPDNNLQNITSEQLETIKLPELQKIVSKTILNSNYWANESVIQYFYKKLLKLNISILLFNEDNNGIQAGLIPHQFKEDNENPTYSLISYTGNHYYNKKLNKTGKFIFTINDIDLDELQESLEVVLYESKSTFINNLFELILEKTENVTKEFLKSIFNLFEKIILENNHSITKQTYLSFFYKDSKDTFKRLLLLFDNWITLKPQNIPNKILQNLNNENLQKHILTKEGGGELYINLEENSLMKLFLDSI